MKTQKIDAAGGVPYRNHEGQVQVLLICRRGVWDLPKGKKEEKESFEECAVREVAEEVGASNPELNRYLTETYHEYRQDGQLYGKRTRWYAMYLNDDSAGLTPQAEEDISVLKWCELEEAKKKIGYENLKKVLERFGE